MDWMVKIMEEILKEVFRYSDKIDRIQITCEKVGSVETININIEIKPKPAEKVICGEGCL